MRALIALTVAAGLLAAPSDSRPAAAGGASVEAAYEISLAGWRLAQARVDLSVASGRYDADIVMEPKGVARIFTAVHTTVAASGEVRAGRVLPFTYHVRADEIDRPVRVDMTMNGGTVARLSASPPLKPLPGRIEVTSAHRRGIVDPLSSGLLPIQRADGRDACDHTLKIFDGWTRYDVRLYFKRHEQVSTEGFSGQVAVCGARWVPVAGHRPHKKEVQYLAANERLEMAVVPLPDAGVAIPYRVSIGTPNGEIRIAPSRLRIRGAKV